MFGVPISAGRIRLEGDAVPNEQIEAIRAFASDPDVNEILRWLDFKSCGWSPDEQLYVGARKLLEAAGVDATKPKQELS